MTIHLAQKTQIASLITKDVVILAESLNYADVFLKKLASELPERYKVSKHLINLEPGKQPLYEPIWSLELVELEILKT